MIPDRFVTAFPSRCIELLDAMEPEARRLDLLGTFTVLAAASLIVVPLERLKSAHFLAEVRDDDLAHQLKSVLRQRWSQADFWHGNAPVGWHFSRIMKNPDEVRHWTDERGVPSISREADTMTRRTVGEVLRTLRNALAHGNILYLNKHGHETPDTRLHWIAFLSRYEETEDQRKAATTYRLVAVQEEAFLRFIRQWAQWLGRFPDAGLIQEAA